MIFEGCLDSNPEYCRSKLARYRLSHPSPLVRCHVCKKEKKSKNLMLLSAYRLLVDEPGEVGGGVGLPGGAQRLQALSYLILLLDPSDSRLLVRQV